MKKYVLSVQTGGGCERARIVIGFHSVDGFVKIIGAKPTGDQTLAEWLEYLVRYGANYALAEDYNDEDI